MPLRVVFMGSDPIALPLLQTLSAGRPALSVVGIFTQPDRPAGRGQKIAGNAIKAWGMEHGAPVFQPEKLGAAEAGQLRALNPDLALVMAYGHILRDEVISTPRLGTVNLHASILPKFRGASPIQAAIATGEKETGVSLMRIVRKLDAGPVADVERIPIEPLDTAVEIEARLAAACVPLVGRNLDRLAAGALTFVEQDGNSATYCRKLTKEDGQLDFQGSAVALAARINGLFPWPGCFADVGGATLKFGLADVPETTSSFRYEESPVAKRGSASAPGTILGSDDLGLLIGTGEGILRIRRLQRPGGRMLEAREFLRGFPIAPGTMISSVPMSPLIDPRPRSAHTGGL